MRVIFRGALLPLLLAFVAAAPARAQEVESIGDWFQHVRVPGGSDGVVLLSLGYQVRGMLVAWSCPRGQLSISLVPNQGVPSGDVAVSWRVDADAPDTLPAMHPPRGQPVLLLPFDRVPELTRGAYTASWLVVRMIPAEGEERAWAYSLEDAEEALSRLSCVRAARQADSVAWTQRPRIPMPPEVQAVQGAPPPEAGPPPTSLPPAQAASGVHRSGVASAQDRGSRRGDGT